MIFEHPQHTMNRAFHKMPLLWYICGSLLVDFCHFSPCSASYMKLGGLAQAISAILSLQYILMETARAVLNRSCNLHYMEKNDRNLLANFHRYIIIKAFCERLCSLYVGRTSTGNICYPEFAIYFDGDRSCCVK